VHDKRLFLSSLFFQTGKFYLMKDFFHGDVVQNRPLLPILQKYFDTFRSVPDQVSPTINADVDPWQIVQAVRSVMTDR
jgi:hypothetical protein